MKHRAAEFEKSLFLQESRRCSSVLLGREQSFARWMLGNGILKPCWRSFTSAPARFPRLCVLKRLTPPTTVSSKKRPNNQNPVKDFVVCTAECSAVHPWENWSCLINNKQENQTKHYEHWGAKHCSCGAILLLTNMYCGKVWIYYDFAKFLLYCPRMLEIIYYYTTNCIIGLVMLLEHNFKSFVETHKYWITNAKL